MKTQNLQKAAHRVRVAGYHTLSVAWGLATGRTIGYSFYKQHAIRTGEQIEENNQNLVTGAISLGTPIILSIAGGLMVFGPLGFIGGMVYGFGVMVVRHDHFKMGLDLKKINREAKAVRLTQERKKAAHLLNLSSN